jgi:hypothetical protein
VARAAIACAAGLVIAGSAGAAAIPFTAGDFLNYRVGDPTGGGSFSGAVPVFIDEYTPAGQLVQSVAMPSTGSTALVASTSTTEGNISLSDNGQYLVIGGYRKNGGGTAPNSDTSAATPRVVGRIAMDGTYDTSTALTDAFSAGNMRGVGSLDGTQFWIGGSNGVRYVASLGATTSTSINTNNVRTEEVFGGILYESTGANGTGSTVHGVRVYNPPPTAATASKQIVTAPNNTTDSYQGLVVFDESPTIPGYDTLYTTRLDTTNASSQPGYIDKYVKQADGTWVAAGESSPITDLFYLGGAYDPITGKATLYGSVFDSGANAKIVSLTDATGFGGSLDSSMVPSTVVTGVSGEAFRGIVVVPAATPEPASVSLLMIPAAALLGRRRRSRRTA